MPVRENGTGGLEAHPTRKFSFCGTSKFLSCGTGILPVHENGTGRQDAYPTRKFSSCGTSKFISCGTGILPVQENGTTSQILPSLKNILHHFLIYTRRRFIQFGNLPGV
ncbi:hypothetical protein D0A37_17675 [Microcoleus vaginatus HSN003]|nr:hypothetical protein D0A37_17675 [Microcoleus vaginatus HSN003]